MAQRESKQSLQDLQKRLAQRLLAAQTDNSQAAQWLAVQVGENHYLIPLAEAGEIYPWQKVQAVPYAQSWFLGVANVRGSLLGVIDLAALLGHAVDRTQQSLQDTSLLVINPALQVNATLVVDRLLGLRNADHLQLSADTENQRRCYRDAQGQVWQELSLQALVQSAAFLHVSQ